MEEKLWFNDLDVLFNKDNLFDIIPNKEMNTNSKINAITRFSLYLSILLFIITGNYLYLYIIISVVIITYLIYTFANKELFDNYCNNDNNDTQNNNNDTHNNNNEDKVKCELVDIKCQEPKLNNPLMNTLLTDNYSKKLEACDILDCNIKEQINDNFEENSNVNDKLYSDTSNIYNNMFNQRAFYTMPNTKVPNDQTDFANWLYASRGSCDYTDEGKLYNHKSCAYTIPLNIQRKGGKLKEGMDIKKIKN